MSTVVQRNHTGVGLRGFVKVNIFLASLVVFVGFTPIADVILSPIIVFGIYVMWFAHTLTFVNLSRLFKNDYKMSLWWLCFWVYQLFLSYVNFSTISPNNILARLTIFGLPLVASVCYCYYNESEKRSFCKIILTIIVLNLMHNIYIVLTNPDIFESISLAKFTMGTRLVTNAGSTSFVNSIFFLFPLCLIFRKYIKSPQIKFGLLLLAILSAYYFLVLNPRGTVVILFVLTCTLFVIVKWNQGNVFKTVVGIVFWLIIILFLFEPVLSILENIFSYSEVISTRLNDVTGVLSGQDIKDEGSLYARFMLGKASLNTWVGGFVNFLFGIGDHASDGDVYSLINSGVGKHSQILDTLARFGCVGLLFMINIFKSTYRFLFSNINDMLAKSNLSVVFAFYIIMGVLNNIFYCDNLIVVVLFMSLMTSICKLSNSRIYVKVI